MKFVKFFQNDDHFKRHYADYICDVKGCGHAKTLEIRSPKNYDTTDLIKCPKCGEWSGQSKKERLIEEKERLKKKIEEIDIELEILEMTTETKVLCISATGV